jgi:hypothetical protein
MKSSNPLQTEESGIGDEIYYAAPAVSPNANHQVQRVPLFTVDRTAAPVPNAVQTLEDQQFEDTESQQRFIQCLTPVRHRDIHVFARRFEEYNDEAHLSAVKAAIQYSETLLQNQDDFSPDFEPSDEEDDYSQLQNPTRPPSSQKIFLECFLTVQLSTGHLKCAMILGFVFVHVQSIPVHGWITGTLLFTMIMDARQLP